MVPGNLVQPKPYSPLTKKTGIVYLHERFLRCRIIFPQSIPIVRNHKVDAVSVAYEDEYLPLASKRAHRYMIPSVNDNTGSKDYPREEQKETQREEKRDVLH
ncbi:MAG: hypothetical protein ACYCQJ_14610 [Nitrososphaerales archaeon]